MRTMLLVAGLAWAAGGSCAEPAVQRREPTEGPALALRVSGKLDPKLVPECSALFPGRRQPGVFWTLSDSGAKPVIVPVRADGSKAMAFLAWWKRAVCSNEGAAISAT